LGNVKLIVVYPRPTDVGAFEKVYQNEHVPLAVAKLGGKTKIVATKILGSPQGIPPFYRIAEVYFPSMQALEAMRCVRRRERSASSCGEDLLWRAAYFPGGRRGDFHVHTYSGRLGLLGRERNLIR